ARRPPPARPPPPWVGLGAPPPVICTERPGPPVVWPPSLPFAIAIVIASAIAMTRASTAYPQEPKLLRSWWWIAWVLISSPFREVSSIDEATVPRRALRSRAERHRGPSILHTERL